MGRTVPDISSSGVPTLGTSYAQFRSGSVGFYIVTAATNVGGMIITSLQIAARGATGAADLSIMINSTNSPSTSRVLGLITLGGTTSQNSSGITGPVQIDAGDYLYCYNASASGYTINITYELL